MNSAVYCPSCGILLDQTEDGSNYYYCNNMRCDDEEASKCPLCDRVTVAMGCDKLLFNCDDCSYIWSYHSVCSEVANPINASSIFIGHLEYNNGSNTNVNYVETQKKFTKCEPFDVPYDDFTAFVWECSKCNEKYVNMYYM